MLTLSPQRLQLLAGPQCLLSTLLLRPGHGPRCLSSLTDFPTLCSTQNSPRSPCSSEYFLLALISLGPFLFQLNSVAGTPSNFYPTDSTPFPSFSLFTTIWHRINLLAFLFRLLSTLMCKWHCWGHILLFFLSWCFPVSILAPDT